jgi:hypothetical protein
MPWRLAYLGASASLILSELLPLVLVCVGVAEGMLCYAKYVVVCWAAAEVQAAHEAIMAQKQSKEEQLRIAQPRCVIDD